MTGHRHGAIAPAALEVVDVVKTYPRAAGPALDGVSLQAAAGEVTALLGPNGAGKTTLVECCVGLRRPDAGDLRVLGRPPGGTADLRSQVGVALQDGGLPTQARPLALLRHLASLYADPLDVQGLAERLGITSFARTSVRRLSGGQRQRVALAAAVVGRPRLVFLDEPTAGLDPQARLVVRDLLVDLCAEGTAVVLTTHDLDEASRSAAHVVIVDHGRVVASGSPDELTAGRPSTVRFSAPAGLDVRGLRLALPETVALTVDGPGRYLVTGVVDPSVLATVTSWCAGQRVMPGGLSVSAPSLEDVFLTLTGRDLR